MNLSVRKIALIAVVVIALVVVVISRLNGTPSHSSVATSGRTGADSGAVAVGGDTPDSPAGTSPSTPAPAATTAAGGDDGGDDTPPVLVQPTSQPDVKETATAFAAAWLNTYGRNPQTWRNGLNAYITPDLAADLADADPESVPAGCRVGDVTVNQQGDLLGAGVTVVTDEAKPKTQGTLTLTLVQRGSTWLVSEIDWKANR